MENEKKVSFPIYREIALNIAQDIVDGKYMEGQKLSGRSVLSSQYGVSPETIRKSVHMLKDVGIVDVEKNSGVRVVSVREAKGFIQQNQDIQSITTAKNELFAWMKRQITETADAMEKIQSIINTSARFKNPTLFTPYEIMVPSHSKVAAKTISDLNFWHQTGATIVAIEREEQIILSPGPYATLQVGDILHVVGDEQALHTAIRFVTADAHDRSEAP